MLKKSLLFLSLLLVSVLATYYLNSYAQLSNEHTSNNFNTTTTLQNINIIPLNTNIDADKPEKILAGSFTITATDSPFHLCSTATDDATLNFDYTTTADYDETTSFSATSIDTDLAGAVYSFPSGNLTTGPLPFTLYVTGLTGLAVGNHIITVTGTGSGAASFSVDVVIEVYSGPVGPTTLSLPIDGATNEPVLGTTFTGIPGTNAEYFLLQVSEDPTFPFASRVIDVQISGGSPYVSPVTLKYDTVYFWRVKGSNDCDFGTFSDAFSFQTEIFVDSCTSEVGGTNIPIIDNGTTTNVINIVPSIAISDVNVTLDISHQFLGNLTISLTSPFGTTVILNNASCGSENIINLTYDDEAGSNFDCNATTTLARPTGSLSDFDSEDSAGNWTLTIIDSELGFTGTLNSWSLELCQSVPGTSVNPVLLPHDNFNFVAGNNGSEIVPLHLEATSAGSTALEQVYTITKLPTYTLLLSGVAFTTIGQTFTQEDINNNLITYDNSSIIDFTDSFNVNITNATNGFLGAQVINMILHTDASLAVNNEFFEKTGISVYPTVSNGTFNIRSSNYLGETKIALYTITGLKVYETALDFNLNRVHELSTPSLATGIYILKLATDTLEGSQKLIIR